MNIISVLEKYLDRANAAKADSEHLAAIMTDMEHRYNITKKPLRKGTLWKIKLKIVPNVEQN